MTSWRDMAKITYPAVMVYRCGRVDNRVFSNVCIRLNDSTGKDYRAFLYFYGTVNPTMRVD